MNQTATQELPMLAGISAALRWCEELITQVSGPLLTGGLAIALIDMLTDGKLLASQPVLLYAWAISQAVGVDGQLVGAAVKCGRAVRGNHPVIAIACIPLIGALGYVAYLASNVFATQQALGISTQEALSRLGMDSTSWIVARSLLAVVLVILSGLLRYDPVKARPETPAEREEREARELAEAKHKAALRQVKAAGLRGTIAAGIGRANIDEADAQSTGNDSVNAPALSDTTTGEDDAQSTVIEGARKRMMPGARGVPSNMMSAPQFRAYLAQNGVRISSEKAVAYVQSVLGCEHVGTMYCAGKAPLMKLANRLIERAQSTGNADEIVEAKGA